MSLYDVLQIPKSATKERIEKSYRFLVRSHCQRRGEMNPGKFAEINKAYTILKDKHKRDFYDVFGEMSVQLLLHNKDSYIITRMFDRVNICLYLFAFAMHIGVLLGLPFLIGRCSAVSMVLPIGVADMTLIIPVLRSLYALYWVYGVGPELRSMIYGCIEVVIVTLHLLSYALYVDEVVSNILVLCAGFAVLETLSTINIVHYRHSLQSSFLPSKKSIAAGKIVRAAVFGFLVIGPVPSFLKPFLVLVQIVWGACSRKHPLVVNACILLLPLLYITTLSFTLAGFSGTLIYIPLLVFALVIMVALGLVTLNILSNIPGSKYNSHETKTLPYYSESV